jgi:gamma-glutamylcyclotransferase (GGCT)/AIG2-like uncharacterized protein YtfP
MMIPQHLFVYGTLRPHLASNNVRQLLVGMKVIGPATVQGRLYDFGDFPGVTNGTGIVHGNLLRLSHTEQLDALDDYEECHGLSPLFTRSSTNAQLSDGLCVSAWIYLFNRQLKLGIPILSGDYAQHIQDRPNY